jgi:hypothetical protein
VDVTYTVTPPLDPEQTVPDTLMYKGKSFKVIDFSANFITVELNKKMSLEDHETAISLCLGVKLSSKKATPAKPRVAVPEEQIEAEVHRLLVCQSYELLEPNVSINPNDPATDNMVPVGKKIWDSVFVKRPPVLGVSSWSLTKAADSFVYIPNDGAKSGADAEDHRSNALYTEVLVNAYVRMCRMLCINPSIRLTNGKVLYASKLKPYDGSQHTVPGEVSARLANSTLINFDDSTYARDYIECICALEPGDYESSSVRNKVLSKVEYILMGRTSHTYNQRFVHKLYTFFVESTGDVPWQSCKEMLASSVLSILSQMVMEGLVLQDNKQIFIGRLIALGFSDYVKEISDLFDEAGNEE